MIDISVIFNCHDETRYIRRSLRSIQEAAIYAKSEGLKIEIVLVTDNSPQAVEDELSAFDYFGFESVKRVPVNVRSLSGARNAGIEQATGAYISTADADDLISFDLLSEMYRVCTGGAKVVAVAKYLMAFGNSQHLTVYSGPEALNKLSIIDFHPFTSRIMVERKAFDLFKYEKFDTSIYAYEDWHLNQNLISSGFSFSPASGWLFYRQRGGSIMSAERGTTKMPPASALLVPETFLRTMAEDYSKVVRGCLPKSQKRADTSHLAALPGVVEIFSAANRIDPSIHLSLLPSINQWVPPYELFSQGAIYYQLCEEIAGKRFTDVAIVPYLTGGAAKYLVQILSEIVAADDKREVLIICGEKNLAKHRVLYRSPRITTVDLWDMALKWGEVQAHVVAAKLVSAACASGTIHVLPSGFGKLFLEQFSPRLKENRLVFYHFCNLVYHVQGAPFEQDYNINYLSEIQNLTMVVTDQQRSRQLLEDVFGASVPRTEVLYAKAPELAPRQISPQSEGIRLLWAGRLDWQKRPELLPILANELNARGIMANIDVYGEAVEGGFDIAELRGHPNLQFFGTFNGVHTLANDYDALIYTSRFDGIPFVLLEAMSAGLPVIASAVGGIPELFSEQTGFLVPDEPDDVRMVDHYIRQIELVISGERVPAAVAGAQALISSRHSPSTFGKQVRRIFLEC